MSVIEQPPLARTADTVPSEASVRLLGPHVVALLVLLAAVASWLGSGVYTIDENAYRAQADQVVDAGSWSFEFVDSGAGLAAEHPPLALSEVAGDQWFAYVRHPAYPALLVAVDPLAPGNGGLVVSAAALVALAVAAAAATQRLAGVDPRIGFWVAALSSPFLVHSQISWAHLPAAAAVTLAFAALHRSTRWDWRSAGLVVVGLGIGVLFRTEGVVAGGALFVSCAITIRHLDARVRWLLTIAGAVAVSFVVDRLLHGWITGETTVASTGGGRTDDPFALQRLQAAIALFLDAGGVTPQHVARLLAAVLLIAAAVLVRRERDRGLIVILSLLALGAGLYGALNGDPYPGLLAAWPLLVPAMILVGLPSEHRLAIVAVGVTWLGLVAIGPADGGGLGWGGRLGLVVLGLTVPIVAHALSEFRRGPAGIVLAAGAVVSLAVSTAGLLTLQTARETSLVVEADVAAALSELIESDDVLISTDRRLGRIAPSAAIETSLQSLPDDDRLAALLSSMQDAGVDQVIHIDLFDHDQPEVPDGWSLGEPEFDGVVRTIVIQRVTS